MQPAFNQSIRLWAWPHRRHPGPLLEFGPKTNCKSLPHQTFDPEYMLPNSIWSQYLVMIMREWWKSRRRLYFYDDKLIPGRKRWQLELKYLNRENVACACPVSRSTLPFIFRWLLTCESNTYRYMFHNPEKYSTVMCLCWQNNVNTWQCFLATSWDSWILNWTKEFLTFALHRNDPIM